MQPLLSHPRNQTYVKADHVWLNKFYIYHAMISIYCMIFLFHCVTNEIYRVTKKKVGHDINIMGHCTFWALQQHWNIQVRRKFPSFLIAKLWHQQWTSHFNATSRDTKNIKEDIHRIFHQSGLWITIETNNKTIKFLGITFNLNKSTYQPFIKANIMLQYIYHDSNHPSITTENIPTSINKWLSYLSSHKESWLSHLSVPKGTWWMRIPVLQTIYY